MKTFREMLTYIIDVEKKQTQWCLEVHSEIKAIIGTEKMIVLHRPVSTYGEYGSFTEIALCEGKILMCNSEVGWVDKPIQPYHGMFWHFMDIKRSLERGEYHLEDNPIKDHKCIVCV